MKRGVFIFLALSMALYGQEVEFSEGLDKRMELLEGGQVRIGEVYRWDDPSQEVVLMGFPEEINRETLVLKSSGISDVVFSIRKNDRNSLEKKYQGTEVSYGGEAYTLLSLNPVIIERKSDGRVLINPNSEIEISAGPESDRRNSLRIRGINPMKELRLSYEYDNLKWHKRYNLNLDKKILEGIVVLQNSTNENLDHLSLSYSRGNEHLVDLGAKTEKKIDVSSKGVRVEKDYIYVASKKERNPDMEIKMIGENLSSGSMVNITEGGDLLGVAKVQNSEGSTSFEGLAETRVDVDRRDENLRFGEKLSRNTVKFSIKNYKEEGVIVKVLYDELPEKWYEMNSKYPYELTKDGVVFNVAVPANSRGQVEFSYIMEKI